MRLIALIAPPYYYYDLWLMTIYNILEGGIEAGVSLSSLSCPSTGTNNILSYTTPYYCYVLLSDRSIPLVTYIQKYHRDTPNNMPCPCNTITLLHTQAIFKNGLESSHFSQLL